MTSNSPVKEALEKAIVDYNEWATKTSGYDSVAAYGELRGIFFNKLLTQLRAVSLINSSSSFYGRIIHPEDLLCEVDSSCLLVHLNVRMPISSVELASSRGTFLANLAEASRGLSYSLFAGTPEYVITRIVNEIKAFKL